MFRELILKSRSYRRFDESTPVSTEVLMQLMEYARFSPSASNRQPLKYIVSNTRETNDKIFSTLAWAGYLKDWAGPAEGERPTAYIVILLDTTIAKDASVDHGIAAQSILLGAVDAGFGGCMLGAVNRPKLMQALEIPEAYQVLLVVALGKPTENVILVDHQPGEPIQYYRDTQQNHYVPKRMMDELLIQSHLE